ncbi:MAG TPA: palindromic element RPE5 domain-containing protein [Rickettsia endosymbiont of Pyrocoelia pectoralis]|nr:palindromic element RPE5 domain-containing protein [Rickettsia endosymbiont of Pyrocoelia pectoralis]
MAQRIDEKIILRIAKDKNLLSKEQMVSFETIVNEELIDNEIMIDILYESKLLPIINEIIYVKICNYSLMQEYVTCGYFLYKDNDGNQITAINNLRLLFKYQDIYKSIILVRKYYFYKLLEKNFAHLTSIKAKYALEFKIGPIIAKNINYTGKVLVFFIIFIAVFFYMPILFHIANNISYFSQNILKSLLFIRAMREVSSIPMSFPQKRESKKIIKKCYAFFTGLLRQNFRFFLAMTQVSDTPDHSKKMKSRYMKINLEKSNRFVSQGAKRTEVREHPRAYKDIVTNFGGSSSIYSNDLENWNRHLRKLAYGREFVGDTQHSTAAYTIVREDASSGSTHKLPAEVEFPKMSNVKQGASKRSLYLIGEHASSPKFCRANSSKQQSIPIYTILVPLYKELSKLRSIIKNISSLDYPTNKLDVKIIIEDDDHLMIKELALYNLPYYFHVIFVPKSFPRTKPKALNYALEYSRGEYLVVYDAEDKPEPDQLIKALNMFGNLPPEYVCLQAKLNFYNKDENLLTKMFSIEYSLWFEYILKGLSLLNLPVPLGGTSNHFKTDILRTLGGWDAYNVTEDAELGVRICSQNYKVAVLDSYTLEESPNSLGNWLNQRSRWIKGFLQTFFIFQAQRNKYKNFTLLQIITIYIFIGLSTYNFWGLPFIIFSIITNKNSIINYLWLVNSIFSLLYLYGTAFYISKSCFRMRTVKLQDIIALILWGSYFILHTIASYKAVFEIIFYPFKWNKTKHGVSLENFEDIVN